MQWVLFAVIGPFRMTANFLVDFLAFLMHCTMTELKKTKVSVRQRPLSKQTIALSANYLQQR